MKTVAQVLAEIDGLDLAPVEEALENLALPAHAQDQLLAASAEGHKKLNEFSRTLTAPTGLHIPEDLEHGVRLMVLVAGAIRQRDVKPGCPHTTPEVLNGDASLASPRVTWIFLTPRIHICQRCIDTRPDLVPGAEFVCDQVCDYCQEPTDRFWPLMIAFGPLNMMGDVCKACFDGVVSMTAP